MSSVLPVSIVVLLGVLCGLVVRRWIGHLWLASAAAALLASALWVGGVYLLLMLTAPGEMGRPLIAPVASVFASSFIPAFLVQCLSGKRGRLRA